MRSPHPPLQGNRGPHEHGSADYVPRFHHSAGRDEGLLSSAGSGGNDHAYDRSTDTQRSRAAAAVDASRQVPAQPRSPGYDKANARVGGDGSDLYRYKTANERFPEGTEIRR